MGHKVTLSDVVFSDTTLPKLYNDPIMSSGSLVLVDFGHSLGAMSGVPANGATIPNIADSVAAGVVGSSSVLPVVTASTAAGQMIGERSSKSGLHLVKSKINDVSTNRYCVRASDAMKNYLFANKAHQFYWSAWQRVTRKFDSNAMPILAVAESAWSNGFLLNLNSGGSTSGSLANNIGLSSNLDPSASTGLGKHQVAVNGSTGSIPGMTFADLFAFGGNLSLGSATVHVGGSQVLYRLYLEDLTVSGRTYSQVKAIDDELYATAFGTGGKFAGDTYSDPATLLP